MSIENVSIELDVLGTDEAQIRQVGFGIKGFTLLLQTTVEEDTPETLRVSIVSGGGPVGLEAPEELSEFLLDIAKYVGDETFKANWAARYDELQALQEEADRLNDTGD